MAPPIAASMAPKKLRIPPPTKLYHKGKVNNAKSKCPCGLARCNATVEWCDRYTMKLDCTKFKLQMSTVYKKIKSTTAIGGRTSITSSTWRSDESVNSDGINTGTLHHINGSRVTDEMRINNNSRMHHDFDSWYAQYLKGKKVKYREKNAKISLKYLHAKTEDELSEFNRIKGVRKAEYRKKAQRNGWMVCAKKPSNDSGGWTEEVSKLPGVLSSVDDDTVVSLLQQFDDFVKLFLQMNRRPFRTTNISFNVIDGSVVYAFKATAQEMENPSQFLPNRDLNIACTEEFAWLLQPERNNIIIQGSGANEGHTIPISWVTDGTIEYEVVCYTQLNGARLAYDLEAKLSPSSKGPHPRRNPSNGGIAKSLFSHPWGRHPKTSASGYTVSYSLEYTQSECSSFWR